MWNGLYVDGTSDLTTLFDVTATDPRTVCPVVGVAGGTGPYLHRGPVVHGAGVALASAVNHWQALLICLGGFPLLPWNSQPCYPSSNPMARAGSRFSSTRNLCPAVGTASKNTSIIGSLPLSSSAVAMA